MKFFSLVIGFVLFATQAFAHDCPVKVGDEDYLDKVGAAIKAAKDCEDGAAIAEACALGASGDTSLAPVAERKCGLDFWTRLTAQEKRVYNGLQAKCDAKYRGMEGTMWVSADAFCRLRVSRLYSEFYRPAD